MSEKPVVTAEEVLNLTDLKSAFRILKQLDIEPKGCGIKTVQDAIQIILKKLHPPKTTDKQQTEKAEDQQKENTKQDQKESYGNRQVHHFAGIGNALKEDEKIRNSLVKMFEDVQSFLNKLPNHVQQDLITVFPGSENTSSLKENLAQLQRRECTVIVTGETAVGKSSLVNLLLGGIDLLPVSQLGCTATICEIRPSRDGGREAKAYRKNSSDGESVDKFNLEVDDEVKRFIVCMQTRNEQGVSPYDRVEVNGQFPMLEEGIVVVDTPGFDDDWSLTGKWQRYMSKPYVIIYVIDATCGGNIDKEKLKTFLRSTLTSVTSRGLDASSILFLCSRMDKVTDKAKDAVKREVFPVITSVYRGLDEARLHCLSITEAIDSVQQKTETPSLKAFNEIVEDLMMTSLKVDIGNSCRWLSGFLKRAQFSLQAAETMLCLNSERRKKETDQIQSQMIKLDNDLKENVTNLRTWIGGESVKLAKTLIELLQSNKMAERLFDLNRGDYPANVTKGKVANSALDSVAAKTTLEINRLLKEKKTISATDDRINSEFKNFEAMEQNLATAEGKLLLGATMPVISVHHCFKQQTTNSNLLSTEAGEETESFGGIGAVVCQCSSLRPSDRQVNHIFADYNPDSERDCLSKIQDLLKLYLASLLNEQQLTELVGKCLVRRTSFDALAKMAPTLLKADVQLAETLRSSQLKLDTVKALSEECASIQSKLDYFRFKSVIRLDFKKGQLAWDKHRQEQLGPLHVGELVRKGKRLAVALHCRKYVSQTTITGILTEDAIIRGVNHTNILHFYGATTDALENLTTVWIKVMETCKTTLQRKIFQSDAKNPGKQPANKSALMFCMLGMSDLAVQICDGLRYLHRKGIVHNEIRTDSIMVNSENVVKLSLFSPLPLLPGPKGTSMPHSVYKAPEALNHPLMTDIMADVYSLAVVLWEMWYGIDVTEHIKQQLQGPYEEAVQKGLRPSLELPTKPTDELLTLMQKSWERDPSARPDVEEYFQFFDCFIKEKRRQ